MNANLSGHIEDHTHYYPLRVYFSDTDAGGVVYHSRYLDMAEHARTECLHLLGINHQDLLAARQTVFVVRSVKAEYIKPASLDQRLVVRTRGKKIGRFTVELIQEVFREDELLAVLDIKLGYISLDGGRPSPLPQDWQDLLRTLVVPAAL